MMKERKQIVLDRVWLLAGLIWLAATAQPVAAAEAPTDATVDDTVAVLAGRYTLDRGSLEELQRALADAASRFSGMQRRMALRRLQERAAPPREIQIHPTQRGIVVKFDETEYPALIPDGAVATWENEKGKKAQVSLRREADALVQEVRLDERVRRIALRLSGNKGLLQAEVRIHGPQLREPIIYTVRYLPVR